MAMEIGGVRKRRRTVKAPRKFVPGRDRVSGYYGRYRKIKGLLGELKFFDTAISDATLIGTMTFHNLNIVVQGNTESNRIGRKITVQSVSIKGELSLNSTTAAGDTAVNVKMSLVQDKQTNGNQFVATDLLETDVIGSFNNLANKSRFRVIRTWYFSINHGAGASTATPTVVFGKTTTWVNEHVKCNIDIEFDNSATTGAVSTQRSNSLTLIFQTSNNEIAFILMQARIRFSDQ